MSVHSAAFEAFARRFAGKKVDLLGLGTSHLPLLDLFLSVGALPTGREKKDRAAFGEEKAASLEAKGVRLIFGPSYLDGLDGEVILRSPSFRPDLPVLREAVSRGAELTGEIELFLAYCPCLTIGVTGSNGKTTTSTLTAAFLEASGKKVFLGGNIGSPLLPRLGEIGEGDVAVIELSSFQLTGIRHSPRIALITNLSPNHLDWHRDMDEYLEAKKGIYLNPENKVLVLNRKDKATSPLAESAGREIRFFASNRETGGWYVENGVLYRDGERLFDRSDVRLKGDHNVENVLAALAATDGLVDVGKAREFVMSFPGVEHRLEFVREKDGVTYVNSSIDSSPSRTEAALSTFGERLVVICGGYDKHIPYAPLGRPLCEKARVLILTGQTAPLIEKAVRSCPSFDPRMTEIVHAGDLREAVLIASRKAKKGESVLLSPASASFDAFKNFEERGKVFKQAVNEL